MEITPETKIRDLIPKDYELCPEEQINDWCVVNGVLNLKMDVKKKVKSLEDYENELGENAGRWTHAIKKNFPRQYYSIILQMIADEICEEGIERRYIIAGHLGYIFIRSVPLHANYLGTVKFDTEKHAEQACDILGDKIKYLL